MTRKETMAAAVAFVAIAGGCLYLTRGELHDEDVTAAIANDHATRYAVAQYTPCPMPRPGEVLFARLKTRAGAQYIACDYYAEPPRERM